MDNKDKQAKPTAQADAQKIYQTRRNMDFKAKRLMQERYIPPEKMDADTKRAVTRGYAGLAQAIIQQSERDIKFVAVRQANGARVTKQQLEDAADAEDFFKGEFYEDCVKEMAKMTVMEENSGAEQAYRQSKNQPCCESDS